MSKLTHVERRKERTVSYTSEKVSLLVFHVENKIRNHFMSRSLISQCNPRVFVSNSQYMGGACVCVCLYGGRDLPKCIYLYYYYFILHLFFMYFCVIFEFIFKFVLIYVLMHLFISA